MWGDVFISWIHPDAHKPTETWVLQDERQEDSVKRFIEDSPSATSGSVLQRDEREGKRTWERGAPYIIFILNLRAAIHEEKDVQRHSVISSHCIDSGWTSVVLSAPREKWCISISGRMTVTCHRRTNKAACVSVKDHDAFAEIEEIYILFFTILCVQNFAITAFR